MTIITVINFLLIVSAVVMAILAGILFWKSRIVAHKQSVLFFVAGIGAASLWTIVMLMYRISITEFSVDLFVRLMYAIGAGAAVLYYLFVSNFLTRKKNSVIHVVAFLFMAGTALYGGNYFLTVTKPAEGIFQLGMLYIPYFLLMVVYLVIGLKSLIHSRKFLTNEIERKQSTIVLFGMLIPVSAVIIFNLIFPPLGYLQLQWIGPIALMALVISVVYAILRHHLFNVSVIAIEVFSALIVITALFNFLVAETRADFITQGIILFLVALFSYFLIRSAVREVRAKEEISRLADNLRIANKELRRLDKAKSEFISIASHQLRTPLSIIKGYVSMILEGSFGKLEPKAKETLERVYHSNENLIKLVGDLLNISRIEAGRMQYDRKPYAIREIITPIVEEFQHMAEEKHVDLIWNPGTEAEKHILVDEETIRQVFLNLIDNALEYTESGYVKIYVAQALANRDNNKNIVIAVEDTGAGIDKDELPHLFGQFERGNAGQEKGITGFGFGLYVARRIVEDHNGTIWAESDGKGKGATFYVKLPLAE